ncbi:hypothetical protein ACSBR1_041560 [Camellia fascicularis]
MASSLWILVVIAIVAITLPSTLATDFTIGDDNGWLLDYNYQAWAMGKDFHVGDRLIFNYPQGAHNVLKVNGTEFQQCAAPAATVALTTGNDVIPLLTPGRKWYMCGVGRHCATGNMKLAITVLPLLQSPAAAPSTSAAPAVSPSAAAGIAIFKYYSWMVGVFGIIVMIIMV